MQVALLNTIIRIVSLAAVTYKLIIRATLYLSRLTVIFNVSQVIYGISISNHDTPLSWIISNHYVIIISTSMSMTVLDICFIGLIFVQ